MISYKFNRATKEQIEIHLQIASEEFSPPLSTYVSITEYASKIRAKSNTFEAWDSNDLIGLIAAYDNKNLKSAYITNVSLHKPYKKQGIAKALLNKCINHCKSLKIEKIDLEVYKSNQNAVNFYKKHNFSITETRKKTLIMTLKTKRDYNKEFRDTDDHKYAYNFDFDVMHHYMIESFKPFFNEGNILELGSFKGDFTKRLIPHFDDITCVEASDEAIEIAKKTLGDDINYINALFEEVTLPKKYDNIILTHVLEHLDAPVDVLKRINDEWLSDNGRFFLVCPNANAPSRQIAVKMGIISHNSAVTPAEKEHGHHITYTLDTLERDAKAAGLKVVHRSGIFFKALANFQWDRLLETDIISKEYLEGCFQLGQQYPDLCSSIFLMCEKG
ncbi:GNAT family N-acetyltransferase [Winogradskyella sp. MIT101101]|uniref:GNAT family N-acetyltransferase n=1 Tax=Winogradskyella sp. MIT101101 TaxID=3098297 RepID=UPI00399C4682